MRRVLLAAVVVLGILAIGPEPSQALPNPEMHPFHTAKPMGTIAYAYGYRPIDLQRAYGVPAPTGSPTVAIVDAMDNPNAESDLAVYRTQFGLPACTTANGCFRKVNQTGGTSYPAPDVGWSQEISLDVQAVSAICPNCKILLVEANSTSFSDLMAGIDYAATQTPFISNSWGTNEFSGEQNFEYRFNKPGVVMTFSTGDSGYGVSYPAASKYVVGVGGTSLQIDGNGNRTTETAWSGAGYGCSAYIAKPASQGDTGCPNRAVADVSAVGDPNTGIAVYASYGTSGGNWLLMGGTSLSAPIIAAMYAIGWTPVAANLFDAGVPGYDGPTGFGSPNGIHTTTPPSTTTTSTTTSTTVAPTTTTTRPPTTTTTIPNKPPVISSMSRTCSLNRCTFTVTATDPERKTLRYAWSGAASTTRTATYTFTPTGTKTITVGVSDGVKTTYAAKSVACVVRSNRIYCN